MKRKKTYTFEEVLDASLPFFEGDEIVARTWVERFAKRDENGELAELAPVALDWNTAKELTNLLKPVNKPEQITEIRPKVLECDVVRFQNNKEKWVAFVGLLDGYPYEIFTGLQDDEEGIVLPKSVTTGHIVKNLDENGVKRYDFQFQNKRGYKTTVEGLSEKFNKEYWNYAKLISGVLRYRMPVSQVLKLVDSLQFDNDNINTWKVGVERALKKYLKDGSDTTEWTDEI